MNPLCEFEFQVRKMRTPDDDFLKHGCLCALTLCAISDRQLQASYLFSSLLY